MLRRWQGSMKGGLPVLMALSLSVAIALFVVSYFLLPPPQGAPPVDKYGCLHPSYGNFALIRNTSGVMLQASLCYGYQNQVNAWNQSYFSFLSSLAFLRLESVEIAEGFAVAFLLCLIIPKLKAPDSLKREVTLPKPLLFAAMTVAAVGFGVFAYAELFNIMYANTGYHPFIVLFFIDPQMPLHAAYGLALASLCFGILKTKKGLPEGARSGLMFGGLSVLVAQVCILLFDYKEMYLHVADFTAGWVLFGFPIMSNWSVLIISSFVAFLGAKKRTF